MTPDDTLLASWKNCTKACCQSSANSSGAFSGWLEDLQWRVIALQPHSPSSTPASIAFVRAATLALFGSAISLCFALRENKDLPVTVVSRTSRSSKSDNASKWAIAACVMWVRWSRKYVKLETGYWLNSVWTPYWPVSVTSLTSSTPVSSCWEAQECKRLPYVRNSTKPSPTHVPLTFRARRFVSPDKVCEARSSVKAEMFSTSKHCNWGRSALKSETGSQPTS